MKEALSTFLKGAAMGAANVIPGVSGGTVAFITGIYERLINAITGFGIETMKHLLRKEFRAFAEKVDFWFLLWLGSGAVISIVSLAKLLGYLFDYYAVMVWAFFFGLILASIIFVGKQVKRWSLGAIIGCLIGAAVAVAVAFLKPASENDAVWYVLICGVVAMASMIIPGLSGSFVLLLMGNYSLIMIESVSLLSRGDLSALRILIPVGMGAVIGVLALSRTLSWVFREFHDEAVALLTGFVAGSLLIIWPWKDEVIQTFEAAGKTKEKVVGYEWYLPELIPHNLVAVAFIAVGFVAVWLMETSGKDGQRSKAAEPDSE